ncbi:hypothetical protein ABZ671_00885 [Micromonospora sp. NPDC006766]|uniref:hypothetical protein n=1 Tax=Micromonospora sp. NPDC006766 TaxID=3154778 RepID=UPI0033E5C3E0
MTSPVVGRVSVEINASAKGFARSLRTELIREFKGAGLDKALQDAIGKRKIKIPVEPDYDHKAPRPVPQDNTRDNPDLLMRAFRQDVDRQLRALAKQAVTIPVRPDTDRLRGDLATALGDIERRLKAKIPTEPGDRREYERSLRSQVEDVAHRVKMTLPAPTFQKPVRPPKVQVEVDPVMSAFQATVRREISALANRAAKIPVEADTNGLRTRLGAQLAEIQRHAKMQVPTEPGARAAYEARLRAMLAAVQRSIPPIRSDVKVDVDRSALRAALTGLSGLASAARMASLAAGGLAGIGAIAGAGAAGLAGLASATAGAVQWLGALVTAAVSASGALLILPGAAAVAASGIAALIVGFKGIGDALKASGQAATGGGGGRAIVDTARQIAQAERGVASAERTYQAALRDSKKAQEDLNQARKDAVKRIEDLNRSLRRSQLDEREAAIRLREAREELARAEERGNDPREIERAQLAYEEAALAVEEAAAHTKDLKEENDDAVKKGVENSDLVQAALERQQRAADHLASATEGLASAQEALAAAQKKVNAAGGGGGVNKFAEAMAKLAPAAQAVVRAMIALRPAWEAVQRSVQQALFAGVAGDLTRLSDSVLPTVKTGLVGVAGVLNGQMRAGMAELSTRSSKIRLAEIFTNAKAALDGLTPAVRPFTKALLDMSGVGSEVTADLTRQFGGFLSRVSKQMSDMAASGKLKEIIENGVAALKAIGRAALDLGGILKGIFSAADLGGGNGGLFGWLHRLNELINSMAGQGVLRDLFAELGRIGDALMPVLLAFGRALVPVSKAIGDLAVAFAPALITLLGSLGGALASLAPGLISLAPLVSTLAAGLQPLADILVGLVQSAAPGMNALLGGLVDGLKLLAPVAPIVGKALGDLMQALAPLLPMIASGLASGLTVAATALSTLSAELGPVIGQISTMFVGVMKELLPVLIQWGVTVLPIAAKAGVALAKAIAPLAPVLAQMAAQFAGKLAEYLPKFAATMAKLVPIIAEVAMQLGKGLLDALLMLAPHLPEIIDAGLQLWLAFAQLLPVLLPLLPPLVQLATLAMNAALQSGALRVVLGALTGALNVAGSAVRLITGFIRGLLSPVDTVRGAIGRMGDAFRDGASRAGQAVRDLAGHIGGAFANAGKLLYQAGRNIVNGLINGIRDMFGALRDAAGRMTGIISDFLPHSPAKTGPLSGSGSPYLSGRSISQMVASGVTSNLGVAKSAAADLADRFAITPPPLTGLAGLAGLDLPDGGDHPTQVEIPIYIGDEVVRVVRTEISSSNRGIRRRATAGSGARR